jgi:hypothetical protein
VIGLRKEIKILSRQSVYLPRFETGTFKIHVRNVVAGASGATANDAADDYYDDGDDIK